MSPDGKVYHLNISREHLASKILIVGDPDRVPVMAEQEFESIEHDEYHRGLRTITGRVRGSGLRVTIVTSGMGTGSLEIVLTELAALNEIDPKTRCRKDAVEPLDIIRVGTCGLLQPDAPLGASIISAYAVGLDNTGLFYESDYPDKTSQEIEEVVTATILGGIAKSSRFSGRIRPYVSKADLDLLNAMQQAAHEQGVEQVTGITVSSSGFFAPQGRHVGRVPISVPDIDLYLSKLTFTSTEHRILNMEMEASFLLHFAHANQYRGGAVCVGVANRREDTFIKNSQQAVRDAARLAVRALELNS
jgi:uridine phosphorylase